MKFTILFKMLSVSIILLLNINTRVLSQSTNINDLIINDFQKLFSLMQQNVITQVNLILAEANNNFTSLINKKYNCLNSTITSTPTTTTSKTTTTTATLTTTSSTATTTTSTTTTRRTSTSTTTTTRTSTSTTTTTRTTTTTTSTTTTTTTRCSMSNKVNNTFVFTGL